MADDRRGDAPRAAPVGPVRRWAWCVSAGAAVLVVVACTGDDSPDDGVAAPEETVPEESAPEDGPEPAAVFPGAAWDHADPAELGFDRRALDEVARELETLGSNCLVVARHGRIAGEWYWNGSDAGTRHEVFSVTKSYTSTLVGIAQDDGRLDIDDRASGYVDEWAGTPAEEVTIRNVLGNDSGRHSPLRDDVADLADFFAAEDATAYAVGLAQDHPPGATWSYNDPAIQTLEAVLAEATGREPAEYAQERIFEPIGARNTTMAADPAGNTRVGSGLQTTCQDAARFGHLFLHNGSWDGTSVVSDEWVREATAQPSQELFSAYGHLWWLNRPGDRGLDAGSIELFADHAAVVAGQTQLVPGAPEDMFWAVGAFGQVIQVHPGTDTVVVRFGSSHPEGPSGLRFLGSTARVVTDALVPAAG